MKASVETTRRCTRHGGHGGKEEGSTCVQWAAVDNVQHRSLARQVNLTDLPSRALMASDRCCTLSYFSHKIAPLANGQTMREAVRTRPVIRERAEALVLGASLRLPKANYRLAQRALPLKELPLNH
jgi:hypothetical protein